MAKVVKQHQQAFPTQGVYQSGLSSNSQTWSNKSKLCFLRAPKRSISQQRRHANRARRPQKCESHGAGDRSHPIEVHTTEDCASSTVNTPQGISIPRTSSDPRLNALSGVPLGDNQNAFALSDHKRPRPECDMHSINNLEDIPASAPAACYMQRRNSNSSSGFRPLFPKRHFRLICKPSLVNTERLQELLSKEYHYYPNIAFLYYVNPEVDDKVNAALRNDAVHNLRFMHNAYFNLSCDTFCKAVNLIDRFIVKVKVKPKYMACVATASYCAASKLSSSNNKDMDLPDPETLVHIARCGGNAADLLRMEEILASKLSNDLDGVTAFDFLQTFIDCTVREFGTTNITPTNTTAPISAEVADNQPTVLTTEQSVPSATTAEQLSDSHETQLPATSTYSSIPDFAALKTQEDEKKIGQQNSSSGIRKTMVFNRLGTLMQVALCSLEVYRYRPACLALGIMALAGVEDLLTLANLCGVDWADVCDCSNLIGQLNDIYYQDCRHSKFGSSRRTSRIGYSSPTPLDTISEDYEPVDEDEWLLGLLFEP